MHLCLYTCLAPDAFIPCWFNTRPYELLMSRKRYGGNVWVARGRSRNGINCWLVRSLIIWITVSVVICQGYGRAHIRCLHFFVVPSIVLRYDNSSKCTCVNHLYCAELSPVCLITLGNKKFYGSNKIFTFGLAYGQPKTENLVAPSLKGNLEMNEFVIFSLIFQISI